MCLKCGPLIKAIDAYIEKADGDLSDALKEEGYTKAKKTVKYIEDIEDGVSEALLDETDYIVGEVEKAVDLEAFAAERRSKGKARYSVQRTVRQVHAGICRGVHQADGQRIEADAGIEAHNGMDRALEQRPWRDYEAQQPQGN